MVKRGKSQLQMVKKRASDQPATRGMLSAVKRELKSEIARMDAKMDSNFHRLESNIHRLGLLIEEQKAENRIVLDGIRALWERQDRLEKHFA